LEKSHLSCLQAPQSGVTYSYQQRQWTKGAHAMTYDEMIEKTNAQLVTYHNELAAQCDATELNGWKQAKTRLIERIEILQAKIEDAAIDAEDEVEEEAPVVEETEAEEPKRTIKSVAVDLLCATAYHENRDEKSSDENRVDADHPKARTVGIAYDEIIRRIQEEFEGCNTSVACLRWYSVKIRVGEHGYEDLRLPQRRPRAKPKTAG